MGAIKISFECILLTMSISLCVGSVIESPRVTYWGNWGSFDDCSYGSSASGFQLQTEYYIDGDDTALNSIRLYCTSNPGRNSRFQTVTSLTGSYGGWGNIFQCPNGAYLNGFQLLSEGSQGGGDDTAANNLRMHCTDGSWIDGDGEGWGNWGEEKICPYDQVICGLRTQVEDPQGGGDDTSLNNVDFRCCDL